MRLKPPLSITLDDEKSERANQHHEDRINELQQLPSAGLTVLPNITLADGVATIISHRLGRRPLWVGVSVPRGAATTAGYIIETRDGTQDPTKFLILTANDYGATVTVDGLVL